MLFKKKEKLDGVYDFLIVGLGNPGREYETTRHNAGFLALDALAQREGFQIRQLKYRALLGEYRTDRYRCLVMKPQTFMNNSGEAVRECAAFYRIPAERILVIYDDISLDVGCMRIRRKGSDGGHNGVKSILYHLGSDTFPRIKIGVGKKPHPDYDLVDWVLSSFSREEQAALRPVFANTAEAVGLIAGGEIDQAMNRFNS
ncbi:MAG: aminoacyl-tRNA hydrolase [Clostridiales bacterium]|nr:aminoacyl-tRNA hydrolase [Clostridiales bacterium]